MIAHKSIRIAHKNHLLTSVSYSFFSIFASKNVDHGTLTAVPPAHIDVRRYQYSSDEDSYSMPPKKTKNPKKRKSNGSKGSSKSSPKPPTPVETVDFAAKVQHLEAELASTKKDHEKLLSGASDSMKAEAARSDAIVNLVKAEVKGDLWRTIKFVNDRAQEIKYGKKIYKVLGDYVKGIDRDEFIKLYAVLATTTLNQHRQYVMNRLGGAVVKWVSGGEEEREVPKSEDILKCLKREIKVDDPQEMALFKWYWNEFLPMSTGKESFKECHRHFAVICKAAPLDAPDKIFMTPECEAFAVLTFENFRAKYIAYKSIKQKYPGLKIAPCIFKKGTKIPGDPGTVEVDGKTLRVYGSGKGRWTKADCGQAHFGGWETPGLQRYNELVLLSNAARKTKKCAELEKASLEEVRNDLGITAATHDEHTARPRPASVPDNTGVYCGGFSSDSEAEEGNEEENQEEGEEEE